jgi:ribosomal protein L7/L12
MGCEAVVQDGAILLKAGNGVLRTERKYKDYVFEVEWKALKADKWDSGIYIRCEDPPAGAPWPKVYQVNLLKGMEGNVEELKDARSKGLVKPGEWNRFKLTVKGAKAELEINGKPAWKADGLKKPEGYIALQAEIPGGGQFLFRDVRITELGAAAEPKEGKTSFDVILKDVGPRKIQVIKEVRAITGLGLKDAKDLVDGAPKPIKEGVSQEEAVKIKERIEAAGGAVEIK